MKWLALFTAVFGLALLVGCAKEEPAPNASSNYATPDNSMAPDEEAINNKMETGQQSAGPRSAGTRGEGR